jgi:heterodisulfide reductase subunit C
MPETGYPPSQSSLRRIILYQTGQDVHRCRGCQLCTGQYSTDQDIPLDSLIQLIIMNDDEILTSRTLWSDEVLQAARNACARELDLHKILLVLRDEAVKRGLVKPENQT